MKYVEAECENKLPPFYVKNSKKDSAITDLALSNSEWMTNQLHNAIWYNGEVFESGFPRNDIFFGISEERKKQIRDSIGINLGIKVVTYAPTFRDNGDVSCYELDPNAIIKALEEKTHEKWILLVRAHPNLSGNLLPFDFNDRIINVSFYPDGQEILLISDVLISDYSSIMMDFFLMKRPILLYVKDELQYKELRGLRPEYYQVPFPHCKDNDELVKSIKEIDMDSPYGDEFSKIYGVKDDGHASERVVDRIVYEMSN